MKGNDKPHGFRIRNLASLSLALVLLLLLVSGVVIFIAPRGRVAHWTGWTMLGLDKEQWQLLHAGAAVLFLLGAIFHLVYNWRALLRYLGSRFASSLRLSWELLATLALGVLLVIAVLADWPPLHELAALQNEARDGWETPSAKAPIPYAEELSLEDYAREIGQELDQVLARLQNAGLLVKDTSETADPSPERALEILRARGVEASRSSSARELAQKLGVRPHDLLSILRGE